MNGVVLQVFLLLNAFLIGVFSVIAVRHARAHFKPQPKAEKPRPVANVPEVHLSNAARDRLLREAEENFSAQLNQSIGALQRDLQTTSTHLNQQLQQLGSEVAISERGRYFAMLEDQRKRTEAAIAATQAEISHHQEELKVKLAEEQEHMKAKLAEEMAAERERLLKQIDTKLADAVGSFLTETLQHNVDLGSQAAYLTATLEEHKKDFVQEVADEAPTTK